MTDYLLDYFFLRGTPDDIALALLQQKNKQHVISANPLVLSNLEKRNYQLKIHDVFILDGIGVKVIMRLNGQRVERICGYDLFTALLPLCHLNSKKIFFLGSSIDTIQLLEDKIRREYPYMIFDFHHGFFEDENDIVNKINTFNPDVLFVALGAGKQEEFISKNFNKINFQIAMGVGGSFDVYSGSKKRANTLLRIVGLEWLYRLIKEPNRKKNIKTSFDYIKKNTKRKGERKRNESFN